MTTGWIYIDRQKLSGPYRRETVSDSGIFIGVYPVLWDIPNKVGSRHAQSKGKDTVTTIEIKYPTDGEKRCKETPAPGIHFYVGKRTRRLYSIVVPRPQSPRALPTLLGLIKQALGGRDDRLADSYGMLCTVLEENWEDLRPRFSSSDIDWVAR